MLKFIIDSDWGSDVMQLTSVLLAQPEQFQVLGATVTFGNAPHDQNVINAGAMLRLLGVDSVIPRFPGATAPLGAETPPAGDCAHGNTGLGDVVVEPSIHAPAEVDAVDFILETLEEETSGSVILIATGPQSNIARAIQRAPHLMERLREIRIMGGCTSPMPGFHVDDALNRLSEQTFPRSGNITEWAEFNFQQAPEDAAVVLNSGIPIRLFPMNCTHQMCFTAERESLVREVFAHDPERMEQIVQLLSIPREIDFQKFGIAPTLHDAHTTLELVAPELYSGRHGTVSIHTDPQAENYGQTELTVDDAGSHWVAEMISNSDAAFQILLESLKACLDRETAPA